MPHVVARGTTDTFQLHHNGSAICSWISDAALNGVQASPPKGFPFFGIPPSAFSQPGWQPNGPIQPQVGHMAWAGSETPLLLTLNHKFLMKLPLFPSLRSTP